MKNKITLHSQEPGLICKRIREECGADVESVARRLNVTVQTIYAFEAGKTENIKLFRRYLNQFNYELIVQEKGE